MWPTLGVHIWKRDKPFDNTLTADATWQSVFPAKCASSVFLCCFFSTPRPLSIVVALPGCAVRGECDWVMCHIISRTYLEDIIPRGRRIWGPVSWNIYLGRVAQRWLGDGMTEWNEVGKREITEGRCTCVILAVACWETCIFLSNVRRKINNWRMMLMCTYLTILNTPRELYWKGFLSDNPGKRKYKHKKTNPEARLSHKSSNPAKYSSGRAAKYPTGHIFVTH